MEIDTNGNVLWKKDFKDNRYLWNFGLAPILPTPDKGYLLYGWSLLNRLYYYQSTDSILTYIIKTDSVGNEKWRIRIGDIKTTNILTEPILTSDSNYIISWTDNKKNGLKYPFYELKQNDSVTIHLAKISKSGTLLWEKELSSFLKKTDTAIPFLYGDNYPYHIFQLKKLKDGNIAIIGHTVGDGFMLKIDEEGNPIWYRKYYPTMIPKPHRHYYSDNGITGLIETQDGGFLLTGFSNNKAGQIPYYGIDSPMLYKVDKYGCLTEGCYKQDKWYTDSVQKIEDSITKELQRINDSIADANNKSNKGNEIQLFPNPTNGDITIKLSASYNINQPVEVRVYSGYGKLTKTFTLTDYTTKISLSKFAKGVYIFKFYLEEKFENKKVVVY